ncbi:succinyl-diaminopimelate desuccinylase [Scopulibacillus darangshiensis]|uniref:Probable succinyl-diaminopimelate desuccinylase n=1 Tax=Scopulibacillus darangshiensis TaxID=442528 RepID=A0A4R2P4C9_9BACL|nr:ArgE/DapE family deacylase [Scopulibacillus darangshiensis]TCP29593.1 succinyl-diaminopimelate desuccinylase [Scopulibacillus darangshiensis]
MHQSREAIKRQVLAAVEEHQSELINLCSELIQFPSENPPGDSGPINRMIHDYLSKNGMEAVWHEAGDKMWNLAAETGSEEGKTLVYCGHTDVVPAGDRTKWDFDPFSGEVKDGWMLGRGASDMKGGLAGILFAAALLNRLGIELPGKLVLAIVPDEETGGDLGVPWLLERGLVKGDGCLIAEPSTPLNPTLGQKGACWFELTVKGAPGHGSLAPLSGVNAITQMVQAIERLQSIWDIDVHIPEEVKPITAITKKYMADTKNYEEVVEHVTVNIGTIQGGTKSNVVPDQCTIEVDCRLPFGITPNDILQYVQQELNDLDLDYDLRPFGFQSIANFTSPEDPICQSVVNTIADVTGEEAYGVMQWASSDARHFRDYDIPVLQYGPAYLPTIHGFNERVKVEDIIRCAKVYALTAIDFLFESASE